MRSRDIVKKGLLFALILGGLFVMIPAVLFANSSTSRSSNPERQVGQTIPTRTPISSWMPIIVNQPTYTPTPEPTAIPTVTPDGTASCTPYATTDPTNAALEVVLASEINNQRSNNGGLAGYTLNDNLLQAARRHAKDMGSLSDSQLQNPHTGSDGSSASTRISDACYGGSRRSEIVGWGFTSIDAMMSWWMNSSIHRNVILSTDLQDYGPAYMNLPGTQYTHYWVVTFGNSSRVRFAEGYECTYVIADEDRGVSVSVMQATPCTE